MGKQNKDEKEKKDIRYRLTLVIDSTHQQIWQSTFKKSRFIGIAACSAVIFILAIYSIIAFTPVRHLIPGYPDSISKRAAIRNAMTIDSLENEIAVWELYTRNLQNILQGKEPMNLDSLVLIAKNAISEHPARGTFAEDDSLLREEVRKQDMFGVGAKDKNIEQIEGLIFYPPVKGVITEHFNPAIGHPYTDISASANSVVSSTLDGTVIGADWNDDTGYTLQIQHANNIVSVYRHNAKLLVGVGDKVKAGSAVALVGNTGKLSTAPHLHFEIWYRGEAVDPEKYINF